MKLPFSVEDFLAVFETYNQRVFPMQVVLYLLAAVALYAAIRNTPWKNRVISGILSFFWLWMGVVYHILFFSPINKAAYLFGGLFVFQGILFLRTGVLKDKLNYTLRKDVYGISSSTLLVFALIIYPATSFSLGHVYPATPTFGLPCPTTIFTFGMLILLDNKYPKSILIIPALWAVIGFSAAFSLGIREDLSLLIAALISAGLLFVKDRK